VKDWINTIVMIIIIIHNTASCIEDMYKMDVEGMNEDNISLKFSRR
jgi:hypothetical protein